MGEGEGGGVKREQEDVVDECGFLWLLVADPIHSFIHHPSSTYW